MKSAVPISWSLVLMRISCESQVLHPNVKLRPVQIEGRLLTSTTSGLTLISQRLDLYSKQCSLTLITSTAMRFPFVLLESSCLSASSTLSPFTRLATCHIFLLVYFTHTAMMSFSALTSRKLRDLKISLLDEPIELRISVNNLSGGWDGD